MPPTHHPDRSPEQPARRKRGEGQWALGYREPLNPNERTKKDDDGLNVRARIENDLRQARLRLDRPGRPARPDALVGALHPAQARDRRRPHRVAGARGARRRVLHAPRPHRRRRADHRAAARHRRDQPDLRPRHRRRHRPAEHPVHWIRIEDVPAIWQRLEAVGLHHHRGLRRHPARHPRLARSPASPPTRSSTARPAIDEILERYIGSTASSPTCRASSRPRSPGQQDVAHEVNDISFVGVVHPEHGPGFDLWVGGGLSTNPKIAQRLGAWVPLDEVPDVWAGVVVDLPRLRLPPAAAPRPDQVPGRRLGRREVPPGAGGRVPAPAR